MSFPRYLIAIAATDAGVQLLLASHLAQDKTSKGHAQGVIHDESKLLLADEGIITGCGANLGQVASKFTKAIARHRHWEREIKGQVPA